MWKNNTTVGVRFPGECVVIIITTTVLNVLLRIINRAAAAATLGEYQRR